VLAPGGRFVLVDSRDLTPGGVLEYLNEHFITHGLSVAAFRDVTQHVVDSCIADSPRREQLLERVPFFVRPSMRPMLGVAGSSRFECFRSRTTTYFIAVAARAT
jgi:hypothetical protein